jgi:putative acetyltransferase
MIIREEEPKDFVAIGSIISAAFKGKAYSGQTEAAIVAALRAANALTISLVAIDEGDVIGHIAFSLVQIDGCDLRWHGLGPVAVRPDRQNQGVGNALIREGLRRLTTVGARGCVVLGDPGYYARFGFQVDPRLRLAGVPPEHFMALPFSEEMPRGMVKYHEGFEARTKNALAFETQGVAARRPRQQFARQ